MKILKNKKMKILFLVNNLNFFISHRLPIAEALIAKGIDVIIGYGELGGSDPELLRRKGFRLSSVPMQRGGTNFFKDLKTLYFIWKFFKKEKPNLAHLITIKPYIYGGIISHLTSVPGLVSAVSGLGTLFIHDDLKGQFLRFLIYPIYRLAFSYSNQKVIFQNEKDAEVFIRWGVLNSTKVQIIKSSGVRLEKFVNLEEESSEKPVVCFAARLLRDKGVYEFVYAARLLKEKGIQARFLLAGDLDIKNPSGLNIDDLNKLKEDNYVEIIGYQKDMPALYSSSHIICLPSYREGLPKSLVEAAAASRAIVTTDVPGCRDAIIPNKTGLLVPVKDPKKLADALEWLIEHPKERIAMGKAGRKFAEKVFPIEKIVQSHLDIYQELTGKAF